MRIYKNKILIALGLLGILAAGCKKQQTFPINHVSIQYVFDPRDSAGTNAQKYLYNIYTVVKVGYNRVGGNYLDAASDDAVSSATGAQQVTLLATGQYSSVSLPSNEDVWSVTKTSGFNGDTTATSSYWSGIRYANEFVNNIGVVPVKGALPNGVGTRWVWKSEARFLRAYFYFELVKRFGGVPLLGNNVYQATDNLQLSRSTFADCIKFIVNECDAIKDSLITVQNYNANQDGYRATQGAALALKAQALLYAASPLYNDPSGANNNPYNGYTNYDPLRWTAAAQAAHDVIGLSGYQLYPSFANIATTQAASGNKELIFIRANGTPGTNIESDDAPVGYGQAIGNGIVSPTQELVNSFPMLNGKAITDPTSGYDPQNPYKDRDPRFGATILYNGATWLQGQLQTYDGGLSRPLNGQTETQTGYYLNKFMSPLDTNSSKFVSHSSDWTVIRYAEMLLDYAEAENEVAGPNADVLDQLYALRARAGIAEGGDKTYGLGKITDKAVMRGIIQNERRIELAFEEQRFFDIRRWKLAPTIFSQPLHGVSINNSNGTLTYNYVPVLTVNFIAPKMYFYPIPYAQVVEDPNLKQNPGW